MPTKLYGIKNCDSVRKARRWLDQHNIDYVFHDLRLEGVDVATVSRWRAAVGSDLLLNRRSTTWKQLTLSQREAVSDRTLDTLLVEMPTLIKRPVLELNGDIIVGFKDSLYDALFA